MYKPIAEIIAGVIPNKMVRNRMRGLLRYGITNAYRLRRQLREDKSSPGHYLSICAIAKDEGRYFKEWIEWHRNLGVEKFYIYDNESTDDTRAVLEPYIEAGLVDHKYWPGYRKQIAAYDDCMDKHRFDSRWIAFIDLDEFIVPLKDASIADFLKRMESFAAVEINWLVYGSGGEQNAGPEPVMQRFRHHAHPSHPLNRYVKSIVNPRKVYAMIGCHEATRISGYAADAEGNPVTRHFRQREPLLDTIRINHYAVKSREEFVEKQRRGRASGRQRSVKDEYFSRYDLNDIKEE